MIEFKVVGAQRWIKILLRMSRIGDVLEPVMRAWSEEVVRRRLAGMGNYAPKRAGQRYIRTGTLGAGWGTRKRESSRRSVTYSIYNTVSYSKWVVGRDTQARVHRGRWWIAVHRVASEAPKLAREIKRAVIGAFFR
jgi:hypothetical protein